MGEKIRRCMMKKTFFVVVLCLLFNSSLFGAGCINLYVDAAPNAYGSPDYAPWQTAAFAAVVDGTFANMASSINPANAGTTDFEIQDEVVYSFGDLGKRLTWIYWIEDTTIAELEGNFEISLINYWGDDPVYDFYLDYYGSTWLEPTKWIEYEGGVIGTAGMAWWGAYGVNTQEALDADIASWGSVDEDWIFTARILNDNGAVVCCNSITSTREAVPVPAPGALLLAAMGTGIIGYIRKRNA